MVIVVWVPEHPTRTRKMVLELDLCYPAIVMSPVFQTPLGKPDIVGILEPNP